MIGIDVAERVFRMHGPRDDGSVAIHGQFSLAPSGGFLAQRRDPDVRRDRAPIEGDGSRRHRIHFGR